MWNVKKIVISTVSTVFSIITGIISFVVIDASLQTRLLIISIAIILSLAVILIAFFNIDKKFFVENENECQKRLREQEEKHKKMLNEQNEKYQILEQNYNELKKKHKAISRQFDNKREVLNWYKKAWFDINSHIVLLKTSKISERVTALQDYYLALNKNIPKEDD